MPSLTLRKDKGVHAEPMQDELDPTDQQHSRPSAAQMYKMILQTPKSQLCQLAPPKSQLRESLCVQGKYWHVALMYFRPRRATIIELIDKGEGFSEPALDLKDKKDRLKKIKKERLSLERHLRNVKARSSSSTAEDVGVAEAVPHWSKAGAFNDVKIESTSEQIDMAMFAHRLAADMKGESFSDEEAMDTQAGVKDELFEENV